MGDGARWSTVAELLAQAHRQLSRAGVPSPRDEARILLAETLGVSLAWVMAHPEAKLLPDRRQQFLSWVERRAGHEPVAYIVGHKGFYGLDLEVNPAVLIPRPETELLAEKALVASRRLLEAKGRNLLGIDLGTGSGAVAVALAVHQPGLRLIAVDSSPDALRGARANVLRHAVADRVEFRQGDLLRGIAEKLDLLVANLPYIPSGELAQLMPDIRLYEPREALDGGRDGMEPTRRALEQAVEMMIPPAALLFEIGDGQGEALSQVARTLYPGAVVQVSRDYAGFERILSVEIPAPTDTVVGRGGSQTRPYTVSESPARRQEAEIARWPSDPAAQRALIERAAALIRAGEVVAFPTDTVYGIGAHAWNEEAVRRLYAVKERPRQKAIALLLSGPAQLGEVTDFTVPSLQALARRFWPGGLTIVVSSRLGGGEGGQPATTVGLRVPDHQIPLALIEELEAPLATTSANLSGAPSPTTAMEVARQIGDRVPLIIDGGPSPGGTESTVIDLSTDPPTIRRVGAVPAGELASVVGPVKVEAAGERS